MEGVAVRVQNFSQWLQKVMDAKKRDDSHGMAHFERVRKGALQIAVQTQPPNEEESLILQLAALCHDVLDHKYLVKEDNEGPTSKDDLKASMEEALRSLSGLSSQQVVDVCLISDNISLSKELAGLLEEDALMERRLLHLRNYVSDADKLDALGIGGLKRLAQYQTHLIKNAGGSGTHHLSSEFLREVAQQHLLHRVQYLRTPLAISEGKRLLRETTCIMASDAALDNIIETVRFQERLFRTEMF